YAPYLNKSAGFRLTAHCEAVQYSLTFAPETARRWIPPAWLRGQGRLLNRMCHAYDTSTDPAPRRVRMGFSPIRTIQASHLSRGVWTADVWRVPGGTFPMQT